MVHDITEQKRAEEEILRQVGELRAANEELERFNKASVGRELRMVELKREVNELCYRIGVPQRYPLDFGEEPGGG
jgi:predicted  nucleic acid-binding Zn-ribbon protein